METLLKIFSDEITVSVVYSPVMGYMVTYLTEDVQDTYDYYDTYETAVDVAESLVLTEGMFA